MSSIKRKRVIYKAYERFKKINDKVKKDIATSFKAGLLSTTVNDLKLADLMYFKQCMDKVQNE